MNIVAGSTINIANNLLDIDGLRSCSDPAIDENAIGMNGHFDSDQCTGLLAYGGGNNRFGDGVGQPVGMSWRNVFGVMVHGLGSWIIWCAQG